MSDYWDHEEYGELEAELEAQVKTTRVWMAKHDEAVEEAERLSHKLTKLRGTCYALASQAGVSFKEISSLIDNHTEKGG